MRSIFTIIFISAFSLFSCKEYTIEDAILNATTAKEIQQAITQGYWQLDQYKYPEESTIRNQQTFFAFEFKNEGNFDEYHRKNVKFNKERWYYRIKEINKKAYLVRYASEDDYKKDSYSDYQAYQVKIENNVLILAQLGDARVDYLKRYNSLAEMKDLPEGN